MAKKANDFLNKLSQLPSQAKFEKHHWADYIELLCLTSIDGFLSIDDFADDYYQRGVDLGCGMGDSEHITNSEKEKAKIFGNDCYLILESRSLIFKDFYPFDIDIAENTKAIKLKRRLNVTHKHYLFLLFSSALQYTTEHKATLTSSFEVFSYYTFKELLPKGAQVHLFGTANGLLKKRRYTGNIWNKVQKFASDINEKTMVTDSDFSAYATGDEGLDLVGWIKVGDTQSNLVVYMGQAACGDEWSSKQHSAGYEHWKNKIHFSARPMNLVFIPFCFRNAEGNWHSSASIGECVLLDRQRLLYLFKNSNNTFQKLPAFKVVNDLMSLKRSAFN